ncbi:hypothetical protein [Halobacillus sp. Marseille-Q1614]|uniref:hypothetical protein n=1 Tax=Halobacillus sp. Marseille-Q1614 TaxID=2709134 RepID=UPI00156E65B1|nr:hypothetical protein [Halobacillus sp. Marseille-Q1614]
MENDKRKQKAAEYKEAPTSNDDELFGKDATEEEIRNGESTKVTKLIYDEYDPS